MVVAVFVGRKGELFERPSRKYSVESTGCLDKTWSGVGDSNRSRVSAGAVVCGCEATDRERDCETGSGVHLLNDYAEGS